MKLDTVTEKDFIGALCALREYKDLSYLTNGPAFLIEVCTAWVMNGGGDIAREKLEAILEARGYVPPIDYTSVYNHWDDPHDGISTPQTFAR